LSAIVAAAREAIDALRAFGAAFRNRNLRRLQLAGIGSTLALWSYSVGVAVYAYQAGGAKAVGLLYFARWGTAAVFAPWLGLLTDRLPRRQVMVATDLTRVALVAGMAALAALHTTALPVYALAVLVSIVSTLFAPASGAILPSLVSTPDELTAANAAMNAVGSVGMFAGPAVGGALLALSGPSAVLAATAGAWLWSALCILLIPRDEAPPPGERVHIVAEFLAGFRAISRAPALRVVVGLTGAQTLVGGAVEVLLVVVAFRLLHGGNGTVGWINTAIGIGALFGILAVAALAGRKRLAGDVGIGALLWGAPLVLVALWPNYGFTLLLFGVIGLGNTVGDVAVMTLLQRTADEAVLGRVFAVIESLVLAGIAVGSLVAPGIVSALGPRGALAAVGAFLPALLVPLWPALRRIDEAARVARQPLELLQAIPMFGLLPGPTLERLASSATEVSVPAMGTVFSQGDRGDRFYVVADGTATVEIDGAETRTLERGDFFGEIALLRDVPRTGTVRAVGELRLYALERDDFVGAVTGHGPSHDAAEAVITARLRRPA
jgi:MFS family permease